MLFALKKRVRRYVRSFARAGDFALLMPHHALVDGGVRTFNRPVEKLPPRSIEALRYCDGQHTVRDVAQRCGLSRGQMIEHHERERICLWRSAVPTDVPLEGQIKTIILSPHADDAALSLGGLMLRHPPGEVLVIDVFTRATRSRFMDLSDMTRMHEIRWAEELTMARMAGCAVRKPDLPDALLRGYLIGQVLGGQSDDRDRLMPAAISSIITDAAKAYPAASWYLPLGIGGHLDHRLVRDAALAVLPLAGVAMSQINLYEDMPYTGEKYLTDVPEFSDALSGRRLTSRLERFDGLLRWKWELGRVYWTQITWRELANVQDYARRVGRGGPAERVWQLAT